MSLDLKRRDENGKAIISLKGRLDGQSWETFTQNAATLIKEDDKAIILDFAEVPYISSAGLRGILIIAKDARRRGGKVSIAAAAPMVQDVMNLARLGLVVPIHATIDEAINAS